MKINKVEKAKRILDNLRIKGLTYSQLEIFLGNSKSNLARFYNDELVTTNVAKKIVLNYNKNRKYIKELLDGMEVTGRFRQVNVNLDDEGFELKRKVDDLLSSRAEKKYLINKYFKKTLKEMLSYLESREMLTKIKKEKI